MCAIVIVEPAGNPVSVATTVTLAPVTVPVESFVVSKVSFALPDATDSALAIGGTSLAVCSVAENVGLGAAAGVVGVVGELPQPATSDARTMRRADARVIG